MKTPRWTLLYSVTSADGYSSRARLFFDEHVKSEEMYKKLSLASAAPTLRPWHESDRPFLEYHISEL